MTRTLHQIKSEQTRERLLEALYQWDGASDSNTLEVFISRLRRKLGSGSILTRPMKGTAARGTTPAHDAAQAEHLLRNEFSFEKASLVRDLGARWFERPVQLYESRRLLYRLEAGAITPLLLTEPRDLELRRLGWVQQLVTLALESRDALAPQVHAFFRRLGDLVVVVLVMVLVAHLICGKVDRLLVVARVTVLVLVRRLHHIMGLMVV